MSTEDPTANGSASPLLDEALRLASVVQEWARTALPAPTGEAHSDCQWCPLCQFAAVLRGERPDVNDKLAEAGNAVVGALRAVLETGGAAAHRRGGAAEPRVERIDLGGLDRPAAQPDPD